MHLRYAIFVLSLLGSCWVRIPSGLAEEADFRCPCGDDSAAVAPLPLSKPAAGVVLGLLELPTIFGPGETGGVIQPETSRAVPVYAEPDENAAVVARPTKPEELVFRETDYEAAAAVVYERRAGWYRLALAGRNDRGGWVKAADTGGYLPVAELLPARFTYLNEHWNGEVWSSPEPGGSVRRSRMKTDDGEQEYVVDVREARQTDRGLWLKVALYDRSPCDDGEAEVVEEGWIPAYSSSGQLAVWYYSRGC